MVDINKDIKKALKELGEASKKDTEQEVIANLADQLSNKNGHVREQIVIYLTDFAMNGVRLDKKIIFRIAGLLRDSDYTVRGVAVNALGDFAWKGYRLDDDIIIGVINLLRDREGNVRKCVVNALKIFNKKRLLNEKHIIYIIETGEKGGEEPVISMLEVLHCLNKRQLKKLKPALLSVILTSKNKETRDAVKELLR